MSATREMKCFGCGAVIVCDDAAQAVAHAPPECDAFKEIIARNASAEFQKKLAERPVSTGPATEEEAPELARMLANVRSYELLASAEEFGHEGANVEDAALRLLREMRRRGWKVEF